MQVINDNMSFNDYWKEKSTKRKMSWAAKAKRFLNSLGFVDYCQDERLAYKKLTKEHLDSNILRKRTSNRIK